ncbi:hypothetical protein OIU79_030493 [Salix purpurea]|uniref:Uncharacterized protein n=1 Tax=Salix purpurea TaxID=77065 RepID=A0A9Q0V910_SALPP|nr:hypothetical protein OIU79_030493 [Salix purpurea]
MRMVNLLRQIQQTLLSATISSTFRHLWNRSSILLCNLLSLLSSSGVIGIHYYFIQPGSIILWPSAAVATSRFYLGSSLCPVQVPAASASNAIVLRGSCCLCSASDSCVPSFHSSG